ncbi:MAG: hypothetical protein MN733_01900, partial [Nitrososphaera sp.]|nr:hypothetical protein [Nitrososphaera sp.]
MNGLAVVGGASVVILALFGCYKENNAPSSGSAVTASTNVDKPSSRYELLTLMDLENISEFKKSGRGHMMLTGLEITADTKLFVETDEFNEKPQCQISFGKSKGYTRWNLNYQMGKDGDLLWTKNQASDDAREIRLTLDNSPKRYSMDIPTHVSGATALGMHVSDDLLNELLNSKKAKALHGFQFSVEITSDYDISSFAKAYIYARALCREQFSDTQLATMINERKAANPVETAPEQNASSRKEGKLNAEERIDPSKKHPTRFSAEHSPTVVGIWTCESGSFGRSYDPTKPLEWDPELGRSAGIGRYTLTINHDLSVTNQFGDGSGSHGRASADGTTIELNNSIDEVILASDAELKLLSKEGRYPATDGMLIMGSLCQREQYLPPKESLATKDLKKRSTSETSTEDIAQTRYGQLAVKNIGEFEKGIFLSRELLFRHDAFLNIDKIFQIEENDVALISKQTGGAASIPTYFFITLTSASPPKISEDFSP